MAKKVNLYQIDSNPRQELRIGRTLNLLGLGGMESSFGRLAQDCLKNHTTPYDFLECLLEEEVAWKEDKRLSHWLQQAKFPWVKTLKDFDFGFQPSIDHQLINELASCRYINQNRNVIFFGPPGVGKTHLSIALGMESIQHGQEVRFLALDKLVEMVNKADDGDINRILTTLFRPKLLILDEMDFYDISERASGVLFKLIHDRYEKKQGAMIFTSNNPFEAWAKLFTKTNAVAAIDRINHNAYIFNIQGESYRVKNNKLKLIKK